VQPVEISSPEFLPKWLHRCRERSQSLLSQRSVDRSARHMENGICSFGLVGKCLDSFFRGQNQQSDCSTARLEFHVVHHRKRSVSSRANHEVLAFPGYLFLDRERGMSELLAESFRGLLLGAAAFRPAARSGRSQLGSNPAAPPRCRPSRSCRPGGAPAPPHERSRGQSEPP
jgi:hypothetical protein